MTTLSIVPDLEVIEDRVGELDAVFHFLRSSSSTYIRDQNASIMELS